MSSHKREFTENDDPEQMKKKKKKCDSSSTTSALRKLDNLKHADPVLTLKMASSSTTVDQNDAEDVSSPPDIILSECTEAGTLLSKLMYPLPPQHFLSCCFRQKAVYIQQNDNNDHKNENDEKNHHHRIKDICENYMFGLDVEQILAETSSENVFLWLRDDNNNDQKNSNNNTTSNDNGDNINKTLKSIELSDSQTAYLLHKTSNHATYCRAPPELEQPLVSYMLRDTGLGCGQYDPSSDSSTTLGRGEVEVFVGTAGHVTDWHYDFQENFTIQLSGCKKWTLRQGIVKHPIRGMTPHYYSTNDVIENQLKAARLSNPNIQFATPSTKHTLNNSNNNNMDNGFGNEVEIILKAGDIFYFPAGMWHKVETIEYGVSINISLMGVNYANLISRALEHTLVKKDEWREVICSSSSSSSWQQHVHGTTTKTNTQQQQNDDEHSSSNAPTTCTSPGIVEHKMNQLLKDLPRIVQEFCNNTGANCILPPILRYPPTFNVVSGAKDHEERQAGDRQVEDDSLEDDERGEDQSPCNGENNEGAGDIYGSEEEHEQEEEIIDAQSFIGPEGWTCKRPSSNHRLVKNPLSMLMKMKDVTGYFFSAKSKEGHDIGNDDENAEHLYILNVNFAGNEGLESAARVKIRGIKSEDCIIRKCCDIEAEDGDVVAKIFPSPGDGKDDVSIPPCLFYYGYFEWISHNVNI